MNKSLLIFLLTLLISCNRGLEPPEYIPPIKLSGDIIIVDKSNFDSLTAIRVAAFQRNDLDTEDKFYGEIIAGNAFLTDNLLDSSSIKEDGFHYISLLKDTIPFLFEIEDLDFIELKYIAVAAEKNGILFNQTLIGIYGDVTNPRSIEIARGDSSHIEIIVDFSNIPPQPF
jgi:hypothetical protein